MIRNSAFALHFVCLLLLCITCLSQKISPGFDPEEYIEMLKISARQVDTMYHKKVPYPQHFERVFRSDVVGLDNRWDLWMNKDSVAVISIRGTTQTTASWVANFYSAMVPAKGELLLAEKDTFKYKLAQDPKAAVHIGWLISMAYLSRSIIPTIDSLADSGIKNFIIMGHSQGGAIAFLLTSYIHNLKMEGKIPEETIFKTYCSAAPKPGNLFYAYEYENLTKNGWSYTVVNSADWVPETPISIQTLKDFNVSNPFANLGNAKRRLGFTKRLLVGFIFKRLDKPTRKAAKRYRKYLGNYTYILARKKLQDLPAPCYLNTSNFVRTGFPIVLQPQEDYYKLYPDAPEKVFPHHFFEQYIYLTMQWKNTAK